MGGEEKEILDDKKYSFCGLVMKGSMLKKLKDWYFAHPPTQEELDKIWDEWEKKQLANLIRIDDTLRIRVEKDFVVIYDLFDRGCVLMDLEVTKHNLELLAYSIKRQKEAGVPISKMKE
jgi:hypothetical protein